MIVLSNYIHCGMKGFHTKLTLEPVFKKIEIRLYQYTVIIVT